MKKFVFGILTNTVLLILMIHTAQVQALCLRRKILIDVYKRQILFGITNNNSSTNIIASTAIVPVIVPKYIFKSAFFDNFSYIFSLFLLFIKSKLKAVNMTAFKHKLNNYQHLR